MDRILVTGAAGFVGFHLINRLVKTDVEIVGLDNINDYYEVSLKYDRLKTAGIDEDKIAYNALVDSDTYANYKFIKLDLADKDNILALFSAQKFDYVINLAAQAGVRYSIINPYAYIESNVSGFLNILEGCRHNPVKHLIYASWC
jgi:UDP-glucuronate 4-epimerase